MVLTAICVMGITGTGSCAAGMLYIKGVYRRWSLRRRERKGEQVIMCLPCGLDRHGRGLQVEVLDMGVIDRFPFSERRSLVPITIEHDGDKIKVKWGHRDGAMYAKLGRSFNQMSSGETSVFNPIRPDVWSAPAPAPSLVKPAERPVGLMGLLTGRAAKVGPQLEAHIPGSLYDPHAKLPKERCGFRIASNNTGRQLVWWASTLLASREAPTKPYFFVLRHTLYSLRDALEKNHALQIVSDFSGECVGFLGSADFPLPCEEDGACLCDDLPQDLKEAFNDKMKQGLIPPEPAMLYDLLLIPCNWNTSKAGLRAAKVEYGRAVGHTLHMRAFDFVNPAHNGVTCGMVPDSDSNRERARRCGVVEHQIANSKGGSGSFAWEGESICLMHMGCKGNNLNYGVPGTVLRQLEGYWLGKDPVKSTHLGFKRFLVDMKRKADEGTALLDRYPPEIIGDQATPQLAEKLVDALMGPPPGLEAPTAGTSAGTKKDNERRHAGGQYLRRLAKRDYNRARNLVRAFKLATNAGSSAMAQLYYWMDHGDDEEYDFRFTAKGVKTREDDEKELTDEFNEWLTEMYYGDSLGPASPLVEQAEPSLSPPSSTEAPQLGSTMTQTEPPGAISPARGATQGNATPTATSLTARPNGRWNIVLPVPTGPDQEQSAPEAPSRALTVTQVPNDCLNREVPTYATTIGECTSTDAVNVEDCRAFDKLLDGLLLDPEELKRVTMDEYMALCSRHKFKGMLTESSYWKKYISPNIVPPCNTTGARKIPHATSKARVRANSHYKRFEEPECTGLFAQFPEWNWDSANNQAKGVWPPTGPKDILDSLESQLKDRSNAVGLDPRTVPTLAAGYPANVWDGQETIFDCIHRHFDALIMDKGVGWHLPPGISNKKQYCESMSSTPETVVKLTMLLTTSVEWLSHATPWQLFQGGFLMPEILKIKTEPHKRQKAETKRWRLIWQTCITQEILSRILHSDQNSAEVAAYQAGLTHSEEFPCFGNAAGMGHHDEGLEHTRQALHRLLGEDAGCAADRKAWDMSVTRHLWMADARLRAMLSEAGGAPAAHQEAQIKMGLLLSAHVAQVGNVLYQIDTFGIVGSGILSTASSNGKINQLLSMDCGVCELDPSILIPLLEQIEAYLSLVMGDDSVMKSCPPDVASFIRHHAARGVEVTGAEKGEDPGPIKDMGAVPFTSHNYDLASEAYPAAVFDNVQKLAWRLALVDKLEREQAMGVQFAVRHSTHREVVQSMIEAVNPEMANVRYSEGAGISLDTFL